VIAFRAVNDAGVIVIRSAIEASLSSALLSARFAEPKLVFAESPRHEVARVVFVGEHVEVELPRHVLIEANAEFLDFLIFKKPVGERKLRPSPSSRLFPLMRFSACTRAWPR